MMRKEKIVRADGSIYAYELLSENPHRITVENDFFHFLTLINSLNGIRELVHVNLIPDTLFYNVEYIAKHILPERPNLVIELIETDLQEVDIRLLADLLKSYPAVKLSIDDFGTRYSNFDRLMLFKDHITSVKFDRTLWQNSMLEKTTRILVEEIKKEGIVSIAEKVEKEEEFKRLKDVGFEAFQGRYWR